MKHEKSEPSQTSMHQMNLNISFQKQELGQDGHRHFVGFQPHFHLNMTSQMQCCKTIKNIKVQYLFDLFETLQAIRS